MHERDPLHRLWRRRSVQDRIIAEACPFSPASRRRSFSVARTMRLHEAGRLGFCQQALQGTEAILGTGNSAQVCSAGCPTGWNPKAHRMAYLPSYLFDSAAERWNRVQADAGVVAAFLLALNLGYLHAGNLARKARRASGCAVSGVFFRNERHVTRRTTMTTGMS